MESAKTLTPQTPTSTNDGRIPPNSPYNPLPGETLSDYLERVPGPVTIVSVTKRPPQK